MAGAARRAPNCRSSSVLYGARAGERPLHRRLVRLHKAVEEVLILEAMLPVDVLNQLMGNQLVADGQRTLNGRRRPYRDERPHRVNAGKARLVPSQAVGAVLDRHARPKGLDQVREL